MFTNVKALVVVLVLAWLVFTFARPLFLTFTAPEDFARRRNVWFALTIAAFLTPNFWMYVFFAAPLIVWAARKDSTPLALYLFLFFVIPPVTFAIPTVLVNQLFGLSNARFLTLVILVPALCGLIAREGGRALRLHGIDVVLLLYGLLQLALLYPYESSTNTLRRAFLFFVDSFLVYFAFSRLLSDRRQLADTLGAMCLAALVFAPMSIFESLRGWLLYTGVAEAWGQPNNFAWLFRSGSLRSQVSTGHSITLGYFLAIAVGFWVYLKMKQPSRRGNVAFFALMALGLFFTYARGPWVGAMIAALVAVALGSRGTLQLVKVVAAPAAVFMAILVSPFGARVIDLLPFIGTAGEETVGQRRQLAETSWRLVQQNPLFGNPFVLLDMEELRTGDNIIDLVNAYAQVALFYGLVGLALYCLVFMGSMHKAYVTFRSARTYGDSDMTWLGASLIACMVSSLFIMATSGQLYLQWISAGLLLSYAALDVSHEQTLSTAQTILRRNGLRAGSVRSS